MREDQDGKAWDLTPVLDLLQSITPQQSAAHVDSNLSAVSDEEEEKRAQGSLEQGEGGGINLGNFNSLWKYLGIARPVESYTPTFEARTNLAGTANRDAYASDGAIYYPPSAKSVKWRDEEEGQELADTQPESPPSPTPGLSKSQRKKKNRNLRKAELAKGSSHVKSGLVSSGSEDDEPKRTRSGKTYSPAPKRLVKEPRLPVSGVSPSRPVTAKSNEVSTRSQPQVEVPAKAQLHQPSSATLSWLSRPGRDNTMPVAAVQSSAVGQGQAQAAKPVKETPVTDRVAQAVDRVSSALASKPQTNNPQTPTRSASSTLHQSLQKQHNKSNGVPEYLQKQVPVTPPLSAPPKASNRSFQPPKQSADLSAFPVIQKKPSSFRHEILPLELRSTDDRNWALLLKLLRNFPDERKHLLSPLQLSINRPQPTGIHVFVDASNILIGFQEHLKRARGIPQSAFVKRVDPSFHALALLLERRRPVAKRVLAGSTPEVAAFDEARQVGYETCILDKVWKAKELTEKQRRMAARNSSVGNGYASAGDASDEFGYMSDNAAVQQITQQKPRWVEQAVDEILHLKILESIVDGGIEPRRFDATMASSPSSSSSVSPPTMVLATGDAAEAEYSSGFLKMVERALKSGWNVEVMAWGGTVSMDYRRLERSARWGPHFKIVELDEYAEELFSESTS